MKLASLLVLGTAAVALHACIKVETTAPASNVPSAEAPVQAAATPQPTPSPQAALSQAAAVPSVNAAPTTAPATASNTAQCDSKFAAGRAAGGQAVSVDLCSVSKGSPQAVTFVYYLGQQKVDSSANCSSGNWTTYPERKVHYPKSAATQAMLNAVCQQAGLTASVATTPAAAPAPAAPVAVTTASGSAIVFDPPSNVRVTPNGAVLCSVKTPVDIRLTGVAGAWYRTSDACGSPGFIHKSQLKFK